MAAESEASAFTKSSKAANVREQCPKRHGATSRVDLRSRITLLRGNIAALKVLRGYQSLSFGGSGIFFMRARFSRSCSSLRSSAFFIIASTSSSVASRC